MAAQDDPANLLAKQSHISVQRYFEISLLLMLGTSFVTLASTGKLDLVSIVMVTGALLVRLSSHVRDVDYSLSSRAVTRLAIFYIFFYALDFLIFSPGPGPLDRMLQATVHLILFATVIKVFSARKYRDYGYLAALSFLMMLASAVLTVATNYLACFTLYVLFAISTFISYDIKRATEAAPRAPEGPFPAPGQNRAAIEQALTSATLGLALGIVVLAALLFFVIPRYRTGYLTSMGMQAQNITGFSESVNLGDMRQILRSSAVVMRVQVTEGGPRAFQGIKWRGVALTSFDGRHWYNDNTEQRSLVPEFSEESSQRFELPEAPDEARASRPYRPLHYRVLLSPVSTDVLFVAALPYEVTGHLRLINIDETSSLHNPQHAYSPLGYDVVSGVGLPSPADLRRASTDYPSDLRLIYLNLPRLDPRVVEMAHQVTTSATNNYDRALAIQNYLRNSFGYSLNPPAIEPNDPIGSFLLKSKKGYCEYFAAAMAVMLRTMGVPSRLVNGFQTGSYNRVGKDFVVRARDAHSWVEVYFPKYGWIPFDPTPPDPNPILPGTLDDYLDAASLFWNEWIINYDFAHQVRLASELEQDSRRFQQTAQRRFLRFQRQAILLGYWLEGGLMSHKLLVMLVMLGILGALAAVEKGISPAEIRFLWAWKFGRRELRLGPREATLTYLRFLKVLHKKGLRKPASQTPREFALSLAGSRLSSGVQEFTRLYNHLRFGGSPVSLARLRELLGEIGKS
jgi:transglutaminase-like putative cysteine protease